MKPVFSFTKVCVVLAGLMLMGLFPACNNNPEPAARSVPASPPSVGIMTDAKRLSDGANRLMDAMNKPTSSFRFSFKGQENINDKYPRDKMQSPQVGPVALQADITPTEINLTEVRGATTKISKAEINNEVNWEMANLEALGVMTNPSLVITLGSTVASPPTSDLVGTVPADKFDFDTTAATPSQRMSLDAARSVQTTLRDCKGTAWIAKDSGLLIKFSVDADYLDKENHGWKEHYEGAVIPK